MKTIGIMMRIEHFEETYKWFINQSYIDKINRHDWAIFPICSYSSIKQAINTCDALLIPGGYDIRSYYLKENAQDSCTFYDYPMDQLDFACLDAFVKAQKPVLGICRGMQVINVYFGGTMLQNIDTAKHAPHHEHNITLCARSFMSQLYFPTYQVNSYHHQVLGKLGKQLQSSAYSDENYIEAIEHTKQKIIGVQWHPERMEDDVIIPYFLDVFCN